MKVNIAKPSDSDRLTKFFSQSPLPGHLSIQLHRSHNYFNKYKLYSDDFVTYMMTDDHNEIHATATLAFMEAVLEGKEQTIGIATDLRIAKSRGSLLSWSNNFLPILLEEREKRNCQYFFSPIGRSRIEAFKTFIRPRSVSRNFPRYHLFRKFNVVTIHGQYPFSPAPLHTIDIEFAKQSELDALQNFIQRHQRKRPFYIIKKTFDLETYIQSWPGLSIDQFLIVKDKKKNIIGCMALWDGRNIETIEAVTKSKRVKTFEQTLNGLSYFGLTHRLTQSKNNFLNQLQINFLYANNPDIFYSMLKRAYSMCPKTHFLSYLHYENQMTYMPPRSFISQTIPYNVYCLLAPNDPIPSFLKPSFLEYALDIDMAMV